MERGANLPWLKHMPPASLLMTVALMAWVDMASGPLYELLDASGLALNKVAKYDVSHIFTTPLIRILFYTSCGGF